MKKLSVVCLMLAGCGAASDLPTQPQLDAGSEAVGAITDPNIPAWVRPPYLGDQSNTSSNGWGPIDPDTDLPQGVYTNDTYTPQGDD